MRPADQESTEIAPAPRLCKNHGIVVIPYGVLLLFVLVCVAHFVIHFSHWWFGETQNKKQLAKQWTDLTGNTKRGVDNGNIRIIGTRTLWFHDFRKHDYRFKIIILELGVSAWVGLPNPSVDANDCLSINAIKMTCMWLVVLDLRAVSSPVYVQRISCVVLHTYWLSVFGVPLCTDVQVLAVLPDKFTATFYFPFPSL